MGRQDEDSLPHDNQPRRQQFRFQVGILALCLTFATIPSFLIPQFPLLVSDINVSTALTVGCVLPPFQRYKHHVLTLDDFIKESEKIRSLARVILWPEGAVLFNNASERDEGLELVRKRLPGTHTGVSFEEVVDDPRDSTGRTSIRRTGIAVVSQGSSDPHIYYKRHLVPLAESFSLFHSSAPPSIFEVDLAPPKDVKKIEWAPGPNYTRSIPLTSSICLDFAFPSPFADLPSRPALILAPARTWERTVGHAMWLQAKQRAAELESIVLWCDGGEGGVSGVAGRGFNDVVQVGSGSFVRTIGIQYPFNDQKTLFARFGDSVLILFWIFVFVPGQIDLSTATLRTLGRMHRAGEYLWQRTRRVGQNPPTGNLLG
jgi:apolipoprotein N-acyltransferase